jgi:intracellular sulfur oxidation DsrE/DsrF family protein
MKVLNIIASGYRATLEEQDDTIVWLTHAIKGAGADVDVLLRGPAANYIIEGQEARPLSFGARTQKHAPDVHGQVASLLDKGVSVFVVEEEINRRGLNKAPRLRGAKTVPQASLPALLAQYEQVWHW